MNENIKDNSKINIDIEISSPCVRCNGECENCPHWVDDSDYDTIANEAKNFRLSLSVDMRKHDHIKINL